MVKLDHVPKGIHEINEWFGGCPANVRTVNGKQQIVRKANWGRENTAAFTLPFPMRLYGNRTLVIHRQWIHKKVGPAMMDALQEIELYAGHDFLIMNNLDLTAGIGSTRLMKADPSKLSMHAYFAAIDICPDLGPYGEPSRMPFFIHEAFIKRGFVNITMSDGMHYQAAGGY